jgi:hypothetical protein
MNLPQNLVDKIHNGTAEAKTFVCGLGGAIIIQVPKNTYIVITGFSYSHFVDLKGIGFDEMRANCIHNVQFKSVNKNRYNYLFRTAFNSIVDSPFYQITSPTEYRNAYQVHDSDIHIDIWRMNSVHNWVNILNAVSSARTNNESPPLSYGTPADAFPVPSVVSTILDPPTSKYIPQGDVGGQATTNGYRNQFINDINVANGLNPPNPNPLNTFASWNFPILNIDYILVSEKPNQHTR